MKDKMKANVSRDKLGYRASLGSFCWPCSPLKKNIILIFWGREGGKGKVVYGLKCRYNGYYNFQAVDPASNNGKTKGRYHLEEVGVFEKQKEKS